MSSSILLIAAAAIALPVAEALEQELGAGVEFDPQPRAGVALLRNGEFDLVLLEEALAAADPAAADLLYANPAFAPVLEINFAISSAGRIVRETRAALGRRAHDRTRALASATTSLQSELNAALTGLLLESQLALRAAAPEQAPRLRNLVQLASDLRSLLQA